MKIKSNILRFEANVATSPDKYPSHLLNAKYPLGFDSNKLFDLVYTNSMLDGETFRQKFSSAKEWSFHRNAPVPLS